MNLYAKLMKSNAIVGSQKNNQLSITEELHPKEDIISTTYSQEQNTNVSINTSLFSTISSITSSASTSSITSSTPSSESPESSASFVSSFLTTSTLKHETNSMPPSNLSSKNRFLSPPSTILSSLTLTSSPIVKHTSPLPSSLSNSRVREIKLMKNRASFKDRPRFRTHHPSIDSATGERENPGFKIDWERFSDGDIEVYVDRL
eukprot:Awhi_evm1s7398